MSDSNSQSGAKLQPPTNANPDDAIGRDIGERVATLEGRIEYLATKEDLKDQKVWIILAAISSSFAVALLGLSIWSNFFTN